MLELFFSSVYAQETATAVATAQKAAEGQPNPLMSFMPFILIFIIFYFLMIRPQKKKLQEENNLLASLAKGDEIYTKSGILGTIDGLTEKIVTLQVAEGVKFKVLRSQIGGLSKKIFEKKEKAVATNKVKK